MHVFLSSEGGPEGRIEIRLVPGSYLVKPVFQVAAGMWTCKAHGHSPTQRGQKAEKGCLGMPVGLQEAAPATRAARLRFATTSCTELLQRGAQCPDCWGGFASLSSA